jgi:hypothetical protein
MSHLSESQGRASKSSRVTSTFGHFGVEMGRNRDGFYYRFTFNQEAQGYDMGDS